MGAPKEVFVLLFNDGTYVMRTAADEARDYARLTGRTVHRYVLAREKREPIAWVVRRKRGDFAEFEYLRQDLYWTLNRNHATRFASSAEARDAASKEAPSNTIRVVALVRKP